MTNEQVGTFEVDLRNGDAPTEATNQDSSKPQTQPAVILSVSEQDILAKENVPELDDVEVKLIREILFSKINLADFEKREIERFANDDHQIRRYIRLGQDRLSTLYRTAACVRACLEWRKSVSLGSCNVTTQADFEKLFSEQVRETSKKSIYLHGQTLLGENIFWFRVAAHKRQNSCEEFKRYVAHQLDQIDSISRATGFIVCIDCTGAGASNIDLEYANYFTKSIVHFRGNLRYVLVLNMGWLLSAAWKIIKSWLPQEQRDHVKMASKKELSQYMGEDQLPEYCPL